MKSVIWARAAGYDAINRSTFPMGAPNIWAPKIVLANVATFWTNLGDKNVSLMLLDGFHRFAGAWREVLSALSERGTRVVLTLPSEDSRPLLFATPNRTEQKFSRVGTGTPWAEDFLSQRF